MVEDDAEDDAPAEKEECCCCCWCCCFCCFGCCFSDVVRSTCKGAVIPLCFFFVPALGHNPDSSRVSPKKKPLTRTASGPVDRDASLAACDADTATVPADDAAVSVDADADADVQAVSAAEAPAAAEARDSTQRAGGGSRSRSSKKTLKAGVGGGLVGLPLVLRAREDVSIGLVLWLSLMVLFDSDMISSCSPEPIAAARVTSRRTKASW